VSGISRSVSGAFYVKTVTHITVLILRRIVLTFGRQNTESHDRSEKLS